MKEILEQNFRLSTKIVVFAKNGSKSTFDAFFCSSNMFEARNTTFRTFFRHLPLGNKKKYIALSLNPPHLNCLIVSIYIHEAPRIFGIPACPTVVGNQKKLIFELLIFLYFQSGHLAPKTKHKVFLSNC